MTDKIITWLDNDGNYRSTTPAYNDKARPDDETDEQFVDRIIGKLKAHYGLANDHLFHLVESEDQNARVAECEGSTFRYGDDGTGQSGAWEMDTDGRPKVNIAKARIVQMDIIRKVRNAELEKLDVPYMRAVEAADLEEQEKISTQKQTLRDIPETFNLETFTTPSTLRDAYPEELK